MTNPRQAEGGYSAQVPVKGPEDGVIHVGQQDVLRPSTREGLGGGGTIHGGLELLRPSSREGLGEGWLPRKATGKTPPGVCEDIEGGGGPRKAAGGSWLSLTPPRLA